MKNLITLIVLIHLFCFVQAQDILVESSSYQQAIQLYDQQKYLEAYHSFVKVPKTKSLKKGLNYYLATSSYNGGISQEITLKYIKNGLNRGYKETILFYASKYPYRNKSFDDHIYQLSLVHTDERAFYGFCMANILGKNGDFGCLSFLDNSLSRGFEINGELVNNFVREYDEIKYTEILSKYNIDAYRYNIEQYVQREIKAWQLAGKFEKKADYQRRVTDINRKIEVKSLIQQYIDSVGATQCNFKKGANKYDTENELFFVDFGNDYKVYVPVPIEEGPVFDQQFAVLDYRNVSYTLINNKLSILHLEVFNPANNKTYVYENSNDYAFNDSQLIIELDDINESVILQSSTYSEPFKAPVLKAETDKNIPDRSCTYPNKFALIIGNENYTTYQTQLTVEQNVPYAINDALVFKEYCIKTIGVPEDQIIFKTNAGLVQMHQSINQLSSIIKHLNGEAQVIIYFAGHGLPDKSGMPLLIPVDVSSASMDMAISLKAVVDQLSEYESKSIVMFLDACFTGGGREMGLVASRGVKIVPKTPLLDSKMVMFSASSQSQSALSYQTQNHGLFTYYLLKKLQETNGQVTLGELEEYLKREVSVKSTILHSQEQTPEVFFSEEFQDKWKSMQL